MVFESQLDRRKIGGATQILLPIAVAHQSYRRGTEVMVFAYKAASADRLHSHQREKIEGYCRRHSAGGLRAAGHRLRPVAILCQPLERMVLRTKVFEVGIRKTYIVTTVVFLPEADDAVRRLVRQRPQQNSINNAKDRGSCADSRGEGEHGGNSEPRPLPQHPHAEADLLKCLLHNFYS